MLLDDTIENNIVFNNSKDKKKLDFCIKAACLDEFVNEFNQKENNLIGENGKRISGGQRQRIGIARAIYRDTNVLILDESFNNLDAKIKMIILNNLKKLKKTIITITHDKNEYSYTNYFGTTPIVLTRCLITTKEMCQYFIDNFRQ